MYHPTIPQEKWNALSTIEQMANIGSEVSRAINWKEKDTITMQMAVYRALELLTLSIEDKKNTRGLKEILRVRECIADYFLGDNIYKFTDGWWQKYFLQYAIAARRHT
jgi:hypothetical protein